MLYCSRGGQTLGYSLVEMDGAPGLPSAPTTPPTYITMWLYDHIEVVNPKFPLPSHHNEDYVLRIHHLA